MGTQAVANRRFLGAAVALHLVTDHQVTEMQELLDTGDPDLDLPSEMTARGYITGEQKNAALAIAEQSISFAGESCDAAAPHGAAADNNTDGFAVTRVVSGGGSSPPHEGESFGQYTVTGTIGEGGLGRVLHAVDRSLQRDVAIKEMLEQHAAQRDKRLLARFLTEARVTGQLQHPGIVPVYQIGLKPDGNLFYVMKYVRGRTMEDALKDCEALPFAQRMPARLKLVDCLIDVCEAIGYAHERNVLHRDIKPGNIVMGHHGENVILDWGLAKHIGTPDDTTGTSTTGDGITVMRVDRAAAELTGVDECIGTPAYMSPEQVCPDLGIVDKRSDVYALGVILYRILTGDFLYHAETVERLLMTIASDNPSPDPSRMSPDCPRDLAGICMTAIDKNKTKRFPDAAAMALELRAWRDGRTVSIYHYSTGELVRRFVQRNKPLVAAMAIAAVAVVAGLAFSVYYAMAAGRMAEVARRNAERARGHAAEAHEAEDKARRSERRAVANEAAVREAVRAIPRLQNLSLLRSEKLGREVHALFDAIGTSASLIGLSAEECGASPEHAQLQLARLARACPEFGAWAILTTTGSVVVDWPDNACAAFSPAEEARDAIDWCVRHGSESLGRVFDLPNGTTVASYVKPVRRDGATVALLLGLFEPPKVLGQVIDRRKWGKDWRLHKSFVYQDDGYELFDTLQGHWGKNLLTHPDYAGLDTLRDFVRTSLASDHGVGEYVIHSDLHDARSSMVHKVGAWQTLRVGAVAWKIVYIGAFKEGVGIVEQDMQTTGPPAS